MNTLLVVVALAVADDDAVGFGDVAAPAPVARTERPWTFGGTLRADEAIWMAPDGRGFMARMRHTADFEARYRKGDVRFVATLHAEADPLYLSKDTDAETRGTYGWRLGPRELYVAGTTGPFDLAFGRQVVGWGQGLLVSPLDLVNGRDGREPGLAELDEQRLPATTLRVQWFAGPHRVEAMWMPEANWGIHRPPGGPWGVLPALLDHAPASVAALYATPEYAWDHSPPAWDPIANQAFLRWTATLPGVDLSVNAAWLRDRRGVMVMPDLPPPEVIAQHGLPEEIDIGLEHRRYAAFGTSGAATLGPLVLYWEGVFSLDRPYNLGDPVALPPTLNTGTTETVEGMVGVRYSGPTDTEVILEAASGAAGPDYHDPLIPIVGTTFAGRLRQRAWHDRLALTVTTAVFTVEQATSVLCRADATVELAAGLHATAGVLVYTEGDEAGPLLGLADHDRVFGRLRYDF